MNAPNVTTLKEYQEAALATAIYPDRGKNLYYPILGLCEEAGEVAGKYKKINRDQNGIVTDENKIAIAKEIGDALWYINAIAAEVGYSLEEIANMNLMKLYDRMQRGVIGGSGDNR